MKKMLVPLDEKNPGKRINDFIYPCCFGSEAFFIGIKKQKKWTKGMVVYTGVDVTANDVFARIVDSGHKIDDVDLMINDLRAYVAQLSEFSIGNVVEVECDNHTRFRLKKYADRMNIMGASNIP